MLLYYSLAAALPLLTLSAAQDVVPPANLVGTWSTKSRSTLTGPGFFNPIQDELIEPEHTGISYSFTSDGYYEEAYYRAISAPADPACPEAMMQWQHGRYVMNATGSLLLSPISVDGRQLFSSPCEGSNAVYTRYNQSEIFQWFSVYTDPYHNVLRLDLYEFNGAPMPPMYLIYNPPQMLPTTTLNPIASSTAAGGSTSKAKVKRGLEAEVPLNWKAKLEGQQQAVRSINADRLWWIGLGMTGIGGLLYLGPMRMGIQL